MRRTFHRIFAALLVGCYVLSVTVASLFHTHGGHVPTGELCGVGGGTLADAASGQLAASGWRAPGECPVCKFLSQKPLFPTSVQEVTSTSLFDRVLSARAIARIEQPLSRIGIRGPPPAA